jgi:putative transposase
METVRIYRLSNLRPKTLARLREAQMEAARVWMLCRDLHLHARRNHQRWPDRDNLQQATKGAFSLHSQTVQMICHAFLANVETCHQVRQHNPKMRYPYKDKRFYPLLWPAQTVRVERGRVVLPMGRGRSPLILHVTVPEHAGACKLVWNDGYELHVSFPNVQAPEPPGTVHAAVDLGEIHQAAVTTNTGVALVVSGRGIRSLKRRQNMALGKITRKRAPCQKGSRRWRKLQRARRRVSARIQRQVRDLRHKGTRKVIDFCKQHQVGTLYIGNPHGVRESPAGRHHHQRMAQWEYGQDIDYLIHKCTQHRIVSFTGTERGTSSRCPVCGRYRKKPKGREWRCINKACGFRGHRDVVGSANMHVIAYGEKIAFPQRITYRRAGPSRVVQRDKQPLSGAIASPS